jgi:osmotically-inducible protein OsmY
MKRKYWSIISAPLVAAIAIGGLSLWQDRAAAQSSNAFEVASYRRGAPVWNSAETPATSRAQNIRSVIKVHTDRGVITLAGAPESWAQVEDAVFVAESIADVQLVNNEVGWTVAND